MKNLLEEKKLDLEHECKNKEVLKNHLFVKVFQKRETPLANQYILEVL